MINFIGRYDHRLWILAGGWAVSALGFSLAIPFLSLYFHSVLGLSLTAIGLYFGVAAMVRAVFQTFGGELSDKLGRHRIMVLAQFFRTITFFLIAFAIRQEWGFYAVGGLVLLNSAFGALFQPSANAAVADLVEKNRRTEAYALVRAMDNLGWAIGPAVGGFLADNSYEILFILSGFVTLISCVIIGIFLRGIRSGKGSERPFSPKDMLSIVNDRLFFRHFILLFFLYLVIAQMIGPLSLYVVDLKGLPKSQLGMLFTLNGLLVAFLQIPVTRFLKPYRLTSQMILGALIYMAAFFVVGLTGQFAVLIIAMILITIGEVCVSPPGLALAANLAPPDRLGRYMGMYGFASVAGWSLGPLLGGVLLDLTAPDYFIMWSIIAALALAAAMGFRTLARRLPLNQNLFKA